MTVVCPYCSHRMRVKGARPGRYKPKCDRCGGKFVLAISVEPDVTPMVVPVAGQGLGGLGGTSRSDALKGSKRGETP